MSTKDKSTKKSVAPAAETNPADDAVSAAVVKTPTIDEQLKAAQLKEVNLRISKSKNLTSSEAQESAAKLRTALAAAESAELELARKRREASRELAGAEEHLTYTIWDGVTSESMKACVTDLSRWCRRFPGQAMTLILNSPGGAVTHGLALYDFIMKMRADGHHITVVVLGQAASMGGILLQAGDVRIIGASSRVLIHEVSAGSSGNLQKMDDDVEVFKALWDRLAHILAFRSRLTVAEVKRKSFRFDWWLTAQEAVEDGFADAVLAAPVEVEGVKRKVAGKIANKTPDNSTKPTRRRKSTKTSGSESGKTAA